MATAKSLSDSSPHSNNMVLQSKQQQSVFQSITSFVRLLWLFSKSDISTFVVPDTAFGILGSLTGALLTTNQAPDALAIFSRIPAVAFFIWFNVLVFEFANQRAPESVIEDTYNKPWRPIPNKLITEVGTRRLLLSALPVFMGVSYLMGIWQETALLYILTWMYNDLKGSDEDFILRNGIIGVAFGVYNEGALKIAVGEGHDLNKRAFIWIAIISAVIFSTMHVQDLQDQVGDAAKGRRSAPLVLGDWTARWTVAIPVIFWSIVCAVYWDVPIVSWILPIGIGSVVAARVILLRNPQHDHKTWVMWAGWLASLYVLPVIKNPSAIIKLFSACHRILSEMI